MIDIERTRKYYRGISENDLCHCIYCDHYIRNIRHAYPEIDRYLRATGADTEKPFEVMSVPLDDNGEILYIAAQYILMGTPEGFEGFKCNGTEVRIAESHPSTDIKEDHFVIEITPVVME